MNPARTFHLLRSSLSVVAVHEAAHAAAALMHALPFHSIAIIRDGNGRPVRGFLELNAGSIFPRLQAQPRFWGSKLTFAALAGPMAELRVTNRTWTSVMASDLARWPDDVATIGLALERMGIRNQGQRDRLLQRERERVEKWLRWEVAWDRIERLAAALLDRGRLDNTEAREIEAAQTIVI